MKKALCSLLPLLLVPALFHALAARPGYFESGYTKKEYRIPMRDGKKLFTAVYAPRDGGRTYPILLHRTPYGVAPYGSDQYPTVLGPSREMSEEGFIFVYQDVRGRMMSEGEFVNMTPHRPEKDDPSDIDESSDAYDTIEWLIRNIPNHNGKVGIWGISYPGFYAAAGMIDAHPAVKAVSPQAPIADWFVGDDFHHNGAFYLAHSFGFLAMFGHPRPQLTKFLGEPFDYGTPDGYGFFLDLGPLRNANAKYLKNRVPFWNELMRHGTYDEFWRARNLRPHLRNILPAVLNVGGWFDAENLFGALAVYRAVEESTPGAYNILVMGPWTHGGWANSAGMGIGPVNFGSATGDFYRREIELPFFRHFLKDGEDPNLPEAYVFATGKNEWARERRWPPVRTVPLRLYFHANGRLSRDPAPENQEPSFDEYISDPHRPVPYTAAITTGMTPEYMVEDQRFASRRPDVLTYVTEALARDITIAGPVTPTLYASTTGTDSDFIVKLIDVYPDSMPDPLPNPDNVRLGGYQQLVRGEPFRGKFRNSFSEPQPLISGEITKIEFQMPDVFHTFRKGHRIMVQVQSSWFPLVDRNPQQFVDIYQAGPEDFIKATQRIYRSKKHASMIVMNEVR